MLSAQGVSIVKDGDEDTTDLMKCISSLTEIEAQMDVGCRKDGDM